MNELVKQFAELTIEKESDPYNYRKANRLYDKRHEIFKKLKEENALSDLKVLFDHENLNVVLAASQYYLAQDPKVALIKLRELSKLDGIVGFGANNLIEQWEKGEITFDY